MNAVPPLIRRLLAEGGLPESPTGLPRCIGRTRRSLLTVKAAFGPLLGDVFTPPPSPPSTRRGLSWQDCAALLVPVIALLKNSIAGKAGFVKGERSPFMTEP